MTHFLSLKFLHPFDNTIYNFTYMLPLNNSHQKKNKKKKNNNFKSWMISKVKFNDFEPTSRYLTALISH